MFPRMFNNYRYDGRGGMMDWYYGRMNPWQIGIMVIVGILVLALIVYLIVRIARRGHPGHPGSTNISSYSPEALKILDEKFAKGELTEEEYQRKKKLITG
ncbi:MAG: SHOCT domain-containing protein [Youngiibacter sp.]|nr:SHOCT domain-containing protein [Youngiibacter sp.]